MRKEFDVIGKINPNLIGKINLDLIGEIAAVVRKCIDWLRFARKFLRLFATPLWRAADSAVLHVLQSEHLQHAAKLSETTSFCPRCGQLPDGDRRMDEAREHFALKWRGALPKRSELDFALAWAYFRRKR